MHPTSQLEQPATVNRDESTTNAQTSAVTTPLQVHTEAINDASPSVRQLQLQRRMELRTLGKTHGNLPGIPIFSTWNLRRDFMDTGLHRSLIAGICGNKVDGVFSLVLAGSYEDDEDGGDTIIYTGSGGRKKQTDDIPPKPLRVGPPICDQSWDDPKNHALKTSYHTGKPIRVIRSWKCVSQYAPVEGYRYDGLYQVAAYWSGRGKSGFSICRCRLEQLPGHPPIPIRPITITAAKRGRKRGSNLISSHHASSSASLGGIGIPLSASYPDMVGPDSDIQPEPLSQRRRIDQAGPSHADAHEVPDPVRETGGTSGTAQQPMVPQPPIPLAVEDTNRKTLACLLKYWSALNANTLAEVPGGSAAPETAADGGDDRTVAADEDEDEDVAKLRMSAEIYDDTPERKLDPES